MLKIDIPWEDEIRNNPVMGKVINSSKLTDFSIALGAKFIEGYFINHGYYWTKPLERNYVYCVNTSIISSEGIGLYDVNCTYIATRPVIYYDDLSEVAPNGIIDRINDGIGIIEFGKWPSVVAGKELQKQIEISKAKGDLRETGCKYRVYQNRELKTLYSINYGDNEYVSLKPMYYDWHRPNMSGGEIYNDHEELFFKVKPVKWYVDEKNKMLIAQDLLFAGVPLSKNSEYNGNPDFMLKYLNACFMKDLTQGMHLQKEFKSDRANLPINKFSVKDDVPKLELNEKSQKIKNIVDEIYSLLPTYYGDEDIPLKVKTLIDEYNKDLKNFIQNKRQRFDLPSDNRYNLSLENYKDENSLFIYLITELEDIRTLLKLSNEKYEVQNEILDLVDICINILDGIGNRDDYLDDLKDDITTIKMMVLPFLENDKYRLELKILFLNEKQEILSYIKGNENSPAKDYKSLNDFEFKFRGKLAIYLQELNQAVRDKDLVKQIREGYQSIILNNYKEGNNKYLNHLFNEIGALVVEILEKGTTEERTKMRNIYDRPIDYEGDIITVLKEIDETYKSLYKIVLDIKEREELDQRLGDYTIDIDGTSFGK